MSVNKPGINPGAGTGLKACLKSITAAPAGFPRLAVWGLLPLLAVLATSVQAQSVHFQASRVRVTVPINYTGSVVITNLVTVSTNTVSAVNLSVSGLPTGATATLTDNNLNPLTSTLQTTNLWVTLNLANVAAGNYTFDLNGSGGASNTFLFTLEVGKIWAGTSTPGNWSDSTQWQGGAVPGAGDDVIFTEAGATNNPVTNSIVDASTTVGSLRFAQTNSQYQTLLINPAVTLAVTGTNGLSFLRDYIGGLGGIAKKMNANITGIGGTLIVSNESGNIAMLADNNQQETLDLSGLGNFVADVNRIGLGDYQLFPNFSNLLDNNYGNGTFPRNYFAFVNLARTNVITAIYADPDDYTNSATRDYSLTLGNNLFGGTSSTPVYTLNLGITNAFFLDSLCFAHASLSSLVQFNTAFTNFSPVAVFRGTNGGRMSMWAESDLGQGDATQGSGSNDKTTVDLSKGTVDALVDTLALSRDRINVLGGGNAQSTLILGHGNFDVNNAFIGYQTETGQTNVQYCQGTLIVSNAMTFKVNNTLTLGYNTSTDPITTPGNNRGQMTVGPGGTLIANTIAVGGPGGQSANNTITINTGANLTVSNTIAGTAKKVDTITVNGGTLTLFINGANTTPYVFVTNLVTSGAATIAIGDITSLTTPAQVKLIQYDVGTPTLVLSLPGGYSGTLLNNGAGSTIDAYITTGTPKSVVWRGYVNNNWDTTTKNWLDLNTGLQTNFANLDDVSFDDATGVTNINLASALIVGTAASMTNTANNYIFSGTGSISGSATLTKTGTGSLDIEGNTTLSVVVQQGSLTGAGSINSAAISSGATLLFSGTASAGVTCAGMGVNSGTINGPVVVQTGGIFTNLNNINGPITLQTSSSMNNSGTISDMGPTGTVSSNAYLLNVGSINDTGVASGGTLSVSGTLEDTGAGSFTLFRLNILSGATFIPGNSGLGTTTINSDGIGTVPGRLSLNSGSITMLEVDPGNSPNSTMVFAGCQDYGPSQSGQSQNGGTLVITNIGVTPYAAGQVFNFFGNSFGGDNVIPTGTSTNSFPIITPSSPGAGLSWDLTQLWPNGLIGVITTPVVHLTNSFSVVSVTNVVGTFSWPSANRGWVLESQVNPLTNGLSTNWTRIAGSWTNLQEVVTNSITNGCVFYRLVYP